MAKKIKVPKRIAGVKVPKPLRRGLQDLARTQNGKTVLAEALVTAAGLLAAREAQPGSKARAIVAENAPRVKAQGKQLAAGAQAWTDNATALREAAHAFTESLRTRNASSGSHDITTPPIAH